MSQNILDSVFWDNKYLNNEDGWDIGKPTPIFVDYESKLIKKSKILIPGCGRGYDAMYLSSKGHIVDALDFSSLALSYLKQNSIKRKLTLNIINEDFFSISKKYNYYYDYIFEYTFFCAIQPKYRQEYVEKCHSILKENGKIISIFLPMTTKNNNASPPYQVTINEVKNLFKGKFNIKIKENLVNSIGPRKNNEFFAELKKI